MLPGDPITEFLDAVQAQDHARASAVAVAHPDLPRRSLHVAAVLGLPDEASRHIVADPSNIHTKVGEPAADALLFLAFSPFHGESLERDAGLLATAKVLLDAGADPNTVDGRYGVPALYAVTGMRSVLPIARLLIAAGANPTDGESLHHAAEAFHEDALELLVSSGGDVNDTAGRGNTPLYFLLRWHDLATEEKVRWGVQWLLDHGADPNVRCAREEETALHVSAWRGQPVTIVQSLVDRGADVHATRGDGRTPWRLATRGGFDDIATCLVHAGARVEPLSAADHLLAACGRGDAVAAGRLATVEARAGLDAGDERLIAEAASRGRWATVLACLAAGFTPSAAFENDATALHHASIHGNIDVVRALLTAGADITIRDRDHRSTPLGWASFGSDFVNTAGGDYAACVRALLAAGALPQEDEYQPRRADVIAALAGR